MMTYDNKYPTNRECDERMDTVEAKVEKMEIDMYFGRGKEDPPVTLRLDRLETAVEKFVKNTDTLKWLLIAALFTMLGDIISNHFHF
jgi:hypothetical protein